MGLATWIKSNWDSFTWDKAKNARYGSSIIVESLPSLEYEEKGKRSISTTVDCYVTGTYITREGKLFSIKQRYSIDVSYTRDDIIEVMSRIRQMIMEKFKAEHPEYNISDVFIPELLSPRNIPEPAYFYRGGKLYRYLTRFSEGRYILQTEKEIYKSVAKKIIKRYSLRRNMGNVRL